MKQSLSFIILILSLFIICPGIVGEVVQISDTPTLIPTLNLTNSTNLTPTPTPTPTITVVITPEVTETALPTPEPTVTETSVPTTEPTASPTFFPTAVPFIVETTLPTPEPTVTETSVPTTEPTTSPTLLPTSIETALPTPEPTGIETSEPTLEPTTIPTPVMVVESLDIPVVNESISPLAVSGNFSFISVPSGASVTFDSANLGVTPLTVPVDGAAPTPHEVIIRATGYQDWNTSIDHNPVGVTETITATLLPQPPNGSIVVTSNPTGATVALDSLDIRTTPYTYADVLPGGHTVSVSKDGYLPYSTSITVSSGGQSVVSASLTPVSTTGSLTVDTNPSGAAILLNGVVYGISPAHFDAIQTGTYNLQLIRHGYQPVSKNIEITAGNENTVQVALPRIIPVTGSLTIRSFPSGGTVTVDGDQVGITPLRLSRMNPDSYNIRVSIPGYLSWIGIINVQAGRDTSVYATLSPKGVIPSTGSIVINSDPVGASVSVDSRYQGKTPLTLQYVGVGFHNVVIAHPGYDPVFTSLQVAPGQTSVFSATLTPYQLKNLTPDLITLSDDAADYLTTYGRSRALTDFDNPVSGFTREGKYVLTTDLEGVVLSDADNPSLKGRNLSESGMGGVRSGILMTNLARSGGGLLYDTNISAKPEVVSLVYVRPALSGVIIGTATPVPGITFPSVPSDYQNMAEAVHSAVINARDITKEKAKSDLETGSSSLSDQGILLHSFDLTSAEDMDQNGVSPTRLLGAVTENGGGYVWVPVIDGSSQKSSLMLAYAEKVDDTWGIWATQTGEGKNVIIMMDMVPISV